MNKELAAVKEAAAQAAESLRSAEASNAGLEGELRRSGQELRDLAAAKDARCGPGLPLWAGASPVPACRPRGVAAGPGLLLWLTVPPLQDKGLRGQA